MSKTNEWLNLAATDVSAPPAKSVASVTKHNGIAEPRQTTPAPTPTVVRKVSWLPAAAVLSVAIVFAAFLMRPRNGTSPGPGPGPDINIPAQDIARAEKATLAVVESWAAVNEYLAAEVRAKKITTSGQLFAQSKAITEKARTQAFQSIMGPRDNEVMGKESFAGIEEEVASYLERTATGHRKAIGK